MGYFGGPNKALTNMEFKRPKLVSFGERSKIVKREGEEKRKRKKKKRRRGAKIKPTRYGTLDFWYGNYLDHGIEWIHGTLRLCMINIRSPKARVLLEFILTLDLLNLGLVKPHMEQGRYGILPFGLDSWLI